MRPFEALVPELPSVTFRPLAVVVAAVALPVLRRHAVVRLVPDMLEDNRPRLPPPACTFTAIGVSTVPKDRLPVLLDRRLRRPIRQSPAEIMAGAQRRARLPVAKDAPRPPLTLGQVSLTSRTASQLRRQTNDRPRPAVRMEILFDGSPQLANTANMGPRPEPLRLKPRPGLAVGLTKRSTPRLAASRRQSNTFSRPLLPCALHSPLPSGLGVKLMLRKGPTACPRQVKLVEALPMLASPVLPKGRRRRPVPLAGPVSALWLKGLGLEVLIPSAVDVRPPRLDTRQGRKDGAKAVRLQGLEAQVAARQVIRYDVPSGRPLPLADVPDGLCALAVALARPFTSAAAGAVGVEVELVGRRRPELRTAPERSCHARPPEDGP